MKYSHIAMFMYMDKIMMQELEDTLKYAQHVLAWLSRLTWSATMQIAFSMTGV
jgi:hypothetical protein